MNREIPKNTVVRITTDNGGDITAPLLETYRATYNAEISVNGRWVLISALRIKTINVVERSDEREKQ